MGKINLSMIKDISLIIPCQNAETRLNQLLNTISNWEVMPNEIIIVDSSDKKIDLPEEFILFTKNFNIKLLVVYEQNLYPGHARNIGISNSKNNLLAFLDTSTFPCVEWLSNGINMIEIDHKDGVWGSTHYQADSFISKIFRACTYGENPIKTFPGTILKKDVFDRCGLFIESARAGEDGDWMSRAELQKINMLLPKRFLRYEELNYISLKELIKKWFRNYTFSAKLPFFRAHKDLYYYAISVFAVLIAFNWNRVLASWDEESIFFIPNVTNISILLIFGIYIFMRGILLPCKKGVSLRFIFPINFIFIALLSGFLDLTKALAFGYSKLIRKSF
jgi:glycosyltransferase involved in cell wall biosynthesis